MPRSKIRLLDVKQALLDARFRDRLPPEVAPDVEKFLRNPGCACNASVYRNVLRHCSRQLAEYFPDKDYLSPSDEAEGLAANHWSVISCHVSELESRLKSLPRGRKQLAVARWEDQVTVVVNEIDVLD